MQLLSIEDIGILRKAAANSVKDYPHRPLVLEMALMGLSRNSIASLNVTSFEQNSIGWEGDKKIHYKYCVLWRPSHNNSRRTRLSESQWAIVMDYMKWRRHEIYVDSPSLFVVKNMDGFWEPMKEAHIRREIYRIGNSAYVAPMIEIPDLHRSMANILRFQGVPESVIQRIYVKKKYTPKPEQQ